MRAGSRAFSFRSKGVKEIRFYLRQTETAVVDRKKLNYHLPHSSYSQYMHMMFSKKTRPPYTPALSTHSQLSASLTLPPSPV